MRFRLLTFATAGLVLTTSLAITQAAKTLTGTVSDTMCGKTHMMKGASAAKCTRECVKDGSDYALVVGDKVYTLKGDKVAIDKFAGENVIVKGTLSGSTVTMESIKAAQ
jgi:N-acetylglucosamine-6-phosphate deacetylase